MFSVILFIFMITYLSDDMIPETYILDFFIILFNILSEIKFDGHNELGDLFAYSPVLVICVLYFKFISGYLINNFFYKFENSPYMRFIFLSTLFFYYYSFIINYSIKFYYLGAIGREICFFDPLFNAYKVSMFIFILLFSILVSLFSVPSEDSEDDSDDDSDALDYERALIIVFNVIATIFYNIFVLFYYNLIVDFDAYALREDYPCMYMVIFGELYGFL